MPRLSSKSAVFAAALLASASIAACSSSSDAPGSTGIAIPSAPAGVGDADVAAMADPASDPPFVDTAATNQRGDPCLATTATNAGVRVLDRFLDLWTPNTLVVDGGYTTTIASANGCAAIPPATWTGIPGAEHDGAEVSAAILHDSIQYVVSATATRTPAQAAAAYYDDRRQKGYSVTDGLGPLTDAWRAAAQQTTTIASIPADATTAKYDDGGTNTGVGGAANPTFGKVVDLVNAMGNNGSTEPAKRFFKYARPFRWTAAFPARWPTPVSLPATLVPVVSGTPSTDGGFPSGHAAEATRDAIGMAYVLPERFQELVARSLELGENRILAGMHSPLDVMGGRVHATAVAAANLVALSPAARQAARDQARTALMTAVGAADDAVFLAFAHSGTPSTDRFADRATNVTRNAHRLTYGFVRNAAASRTALVPKGAEILLETRFPYLTADQRRVVLKTTALPAGYPLLDDGEGWGRLDLFTAADGYAAFDGDVLVTMDASLGGFSAADAWRNDIPGAGKLTKGGTGSLRLAGHNTYTGGTVLEDGTLEADSTAALGAGDVYLSAGKLVSAAPAALHVGGKLTVRSGATVRLVLAGGDAGRLAAAGIVTLDGGTLSVGFSSAGDRPAVGDTLQVITAGARYGTFASVTVDGFTRVTPIYTATGVQLRIDG
jgi:autotransporter-associated beta strand protein